MSNEIVLTKARTLLGQLRSRHKDLVESTRCYLKVRELVDSASFGLETRRLLHNLFTDISFLAKGWSFTPSPAKHASTSSSTPSNSRPSSMYNPALVTIALGDSSTSESPPADDAGRSAGVLNAAAAQLDDTLLFDASNPFGTPPAAEVTAAAAAVAVAAATAAVAVAVEAEAEAEDDNEAEVSSDGDSGDATDYDDVEEEEEEDHAESLETRETRSFSLPATLPPAQLKDTLSLSVNSGANNDETQPTYLYTRKQPSTAVERVPPPVPPPLWSPFGDSLATYAEELAADVAEAWTRARAEQQSKV